MLTAMSDDYTQIMSFDEEADDYITKPFSIIVLHKRIEALLRRGVKVSENKKWCYGDIEIDFEEVLGNIYRVDFEDESDLFDAKSVSEQQNKKMLELFAESSNKTQIKQLLKLILKFSPQTLHIIFIFL